MFFLLPLEHLNFATCFVFNFANVLRTSTFSAQTQVKLRFMHLKGLNRAFLLCLLLILSVVVLFIRWPRNRHRHRMTIVLSTPRSGSSYFGRLVSLRPAKATLYIFEPFRLKRKDELKFEVIDEKFYPEILDGIFNCDREVLTRLNESFAYVVDLVESCKVAVHIVVKTIRLRFKVLEAWLRSSRSLSKSQLRPPVRVLHLVRDPRARFYSMLKVVVSFG